MEKVIFKQRKKLLILVLLFLCINACNVSQIGAVLFNDDKEAEMGGDWDDDNNIQRNLIYIPISILYNQQYLTIQDSNPVNTITVKITSNETGATVFENVYPQGQTSFIVIPMNGWSAGSYTIELFGRENNGYLWGTFQVLP